MKRVHAPSDMYGYPFFEIHGGRGSYPATLGQPEEAGGFHLDGIMCEADARLMAAAPEMLAALTRVEKVMTELRAKGEPLKTIRTAIALATEART